MLARKETAQMSPGKVGDANYGSGESMNRAGNPI
jgi:hypothetical protein